MKRFLYLIIPVVAVVAVIAVGYLMRYQAGAPGSVPGGSGTLPSVSPFKGGSPQNTSGGNQLGNTPPSQYLGQKFGVVSQLPALDYFVDPQNNLTVIEPTGQIVKTAPSGEQTTLSPSLITNLIRASFSYDGKKALAIFGDSAKPQASVFDLLNKAWQPLPTTTLFPVWSPADYQIAYLNDKTNAVALTTLDTANPKAKPVEWVTLHVQDLAPLWISPSQILLADRPSASIAGSLWSFDMKKKLLSPIASGIVGLESQWNGGLNQGLLFASTGKFGGSLAIADSQGTTLQQLSFLTLPSKCVFDKKIIPASSTPVAASTSTKKNAPPAPTSTISWVIDCAIPRDADKLNSYPLPDAYETKELLTVDDFYQIDMVSGVTTQIFGDQSQTVDATNLKVANNTVFFVNRFNQKVYAISLK